MTEVVIVGVAVWVVVFAGFFFVPDLWRFGQLRIRLWLTPDRPRLTERQLRGIAGGRK